MFSYCPSDHEDVAFGQRVVGMRIIGKGNGRGLRSLGKLQPQRIGGERLGIGGHGLATGRLVSLGAVFDDISGECYAVSLRHYRLPEYVSGYRLLVLPARLINHSLRIPETPDVAPFRSLANAGGNSFNSCCPADTAFSREANARSLHRFRRRRKRIRDENSAAWPDDDGKGYNIELVALPTKWRPVVRERKEPEMFTRGREARQSAKFAAMFFASMSIEDSSEAALKGLAFEARSRTAENNNAVWLGIADAAGRHR